jgi:hypothetical protein
VKGRDLAGLIERLKGTGTLGHEPPGDPVGWLVGEINHPVDVFGNDAEVPTGV